MIAAATIPSIRQRDQPATSRNQHRIEAVEVFAPRIRRIRLWVGVDEYYGGSTCEVPPDDHSFEAVRTSGQALEIQQRCLRDVERGFLDVVLRAQVVHLAQPEVSGFYNRVKIAAALAEYIRTHIIGPFKIGFEAWLTDKNSTASFVRRKLEMLRMTSGARLSTEGTEDDVRFTALEEEGWNTIQGRGVQVANRAVAVRRVQRVKFERDTSQIDSSI